MADRKADWRKIKYEYENTPESFNSLAKKYGVARQTVMYHAEKDNWVKGGAESTGFREEDEVETQCLKGAASAARVATQKILEMELYGCDNAQDLRSYMNVLLDAQKAAGAFTGWTKRELQARIRQIEKQTGDQDDSETGVVVLPEILPPAPIKGNSEAV